MKVKKNLVLKILEAEAEIPKGSILLQPSNSKPDAFMFLVPEDTRGLFEKILNILKLKS